MLFVFLFQTPSHKRRFIQRSGDNFLDWSVGCSSQFGVNLIKTFVTDQGDQISRLFAN
jgi:hypothetical protein